MLETVISALSVVELPQRILSPTSTTPSALTSAVPATLCCVLKMFNGIDGHAPAHTQAVALATGVSGKLLLHPRNRYWLSWTRFISRATPSFSASAIEHPQNDCGRSR